ncbi:ribulose phosphate epimerase [Mesomycoplasma ovipneumoniae]|uniref:ribulose phosphate epimerase n=1 Tax=Mesomycoplasma ovipneumoniae TaxID=29562 RepID=UPI00307FDDE5
MEYSQSISALNIFKVIKILTKLQNNGLKYAHIDFVDQIYAPNFGLNYQIANYLIKLFPNIEFDAHLMCKNSLEKVEKLVQIGFKTIFLPAEQVSKTDFERLNKSYSSINFGLMIQAEQKIEDFSEIISCSNLILLMTIDKIGGVGEPLNQQLLSKIVQIRLINKKIKIYTDGGLRKENWAKLEKWKVDVAIGGSIIFSYANFSEFSRLWGNQKNALNEYCFVFNGRVAVSYFDLFHFQKIIWKNPRKNISTKTNFGRKIHNWCSWNYKCLRRCKSYDKFALKKSFFKTKLFSFTWSYC